MPQQTRNHYLGDVVIISAVVAPHISRAAGGVLQGLALLHRGAEAVGVVVGSATFKGNPTVTQEYKKKPVCMQSRWEEVNSKGKYTCTQINMPHACDCSILIFSYSQVQVLENVALFFLIWGIKLKEY